MPRGDDPHAPCTCALLPCRTRSEAHEMQVAYATYFDKHYVIKGLSLYWSLRQHARHWILWILCLDDGTWDLLRRMNLPNVYLVQLSTMELCDAELAGARGTR